MTAQRFQTGTETSEVPGLTSSLLECRQENEQKAEKGEDRRRNRTRQNNKTADRKVESNDSPDIPDKGEAT